MIPWAHSRLPSKWHLDWFSHFCRAHKTWPTDYQTDTRTGNATPSVAVGRI